MSDLTITGTRLSTILIIRNDGTTGWQDSDYCLQKGELGIEYLDNGNVIVRSGVDGKTRWPNCPQVEGVLEENLKLNYDFGKYKTVNGYIDAGGKGMTISEWIKSCLQETKDPSIQQPTYTLSTSTIGTDSGTYEIGSKVKTLAWNGNATTGSYEYGSKDSENNTYTKENGTGITKSFEMYHSEDMNTRMGTTEDGTYTLKTFIEIKNDSSTNLGSITGTYSWNDSPRQPVNNVGDKVDGAIVSGSISKTANYSVTGYREGFFYGWFNSAKEVTDITGEGIRANTLTEKVDGITYKTSKKYASTIDSKGKDTPITFTVQAGAATLFMAWPKGKPGVTNILNTTVNANMNEAFEINTPYDIEIGGFNNNYPDDYEMIVYTPATAYETVTELKITLGKEA